MTRRSRRGAGWLVGIALLGATASCGSAADSSSPSAGSGRDPDATVASGTSTESGGAPDAGEDGPLEDIGDGSGLGARICAILTGDEIAVIVGGSVRDGEVAGPLGSACSWDLPGDGLVLVQVVPPDFWTSVEDPDDPSYQELSGIGTAAFVQSGLVAGWVAAALYDDRMVLAEVSGPAATAELATALLEASVDQLV